MHHVSHCTAVVGYVRNKGFVCVREETKELAAAPPAAEEVLMSSSCRPRFWAAAVIALQTVCCFGAYAEGQHTVDHDDVPTLIATTHTNTFD